jgi:hypothetical protein
MKTEYVTKDLICNRDGTVTYWSTLRHEWILRVSAISNEELVAMSADNRERVLYHLTHHGRIKGGYRYSSATEA